MNVIDVERIMPRANVMLKALGNSHRLMVVAYLLHGEMSVGELGRAIGLSQSALSQHLARLRRENLVKTRREAQTIYYSLVGHEARAMVDALVDIFGEHKDIDTDSGSSHQKTFVSAR